MLGLLADNYRGETVQESSRLLRLLLPHFEIARSRASIERLGAQHDGVLRAHMPASDGGIRDTAVYSLLADEWPAARAALAERLRPD